MLKEDLLLNEISDWYNSGTVTSFINNNFCKTRAEFNGRLASYEKPLSHSFSIDCVYLLISSLGEIGNNCFDHNLGYWQESPGCLFVREKNFCIIADRGQGIFNSLKKVMSLENINPIEYAFLNVVTGRFPEKRGNGLKHVRRSLSHCKVSISVYSGEFFYYIGDKSRNDLKLKNDGVFCLLAW